jgi:hypothetical protein
LSENLAFYRRLVIAPAIPAIALAISATVSMDASGAKKIR